MAVKVDPVVQEIVASMSELVLASGSAIRATLLRNAGLEIRVARAQIEERAVEAPLLESDFSPEDIAVVLAEAKATDVSSREPGALVVGADQVLELDGERLVKADTMDQARRQLLRLSGRDHALKSAVAVVRDGETLWRHVATARLTMRTLSPSLVGHYLARVGDAALESVGSYQLEGLGAQLFEGIDGEYFTVLGLPLLPLLGFLRSVGELES